MRDFLKQFLKTCVVLGLLSAILASCVTSKKVQYVQKDDVAKKTGEMPNDTILRKYSLTLEDYKIQPMDLLSIRVETITDEEFDFAAKLNPTANVAGGANQMLSGFLVDNNGDVEYPVIGRIHVAGLSVFETQDK